MGRPRKVYHPTEFFANVDIVNGCWLWRGATFGSGYGRVLWEGRTYRSNRLAYILAVGPIPASLLICHHCDNRLCVNPDHLYLGTFDGNMYDKASRGRNTQRKLTPDTVRAMRADRAAGATFQEISDRYSIGMTQTWRAVVGQSYRDVTDEPLAS
jgi:hypothetical protein